MVQFVWNLLAWLATPRKSGSLWFTNSPLEDFPLLSDCPSMTEYKYPSILWPSLIYYFTHWMCDFFLNAGTTVYRSPSTLITDSTATCTIILVTCILLMLGQDILKRRRKRSLVSCYKLADVSADSKTKRFNTICKLQTVYSKSLLLCLLRVMSSQTSWCQEPFHHGTGFQRMWSGLPPLMLIWHHRYSHAPLLSRDFEAIHPLPWCSAQLEHAKYCKEEVHTQLCSFFFISVCGWVGESGL